MTWVYSICDICSTAFYRLPNTSTLTCVTCMSRRLDECRRELDECKVRTMARLRFLCIEFERDPADYVGKGDVVIVVQGKVEEPLFAHKFILSSKSPVFRKMFNAKMLEEEKGIVNVDDPPRNVICAVIKFCYDAEVNFTEEVTVEGVLEVAHKYDIVLLQKICEEELIATMTCDNLPKKLKIAMKFEAKDLEAAATQFLKHHYDDVISDVLASAWKSFQGT